MPNARDVILRHIDAFNGRGSDADPWAADAEFTAPGAKVSGRDNVIGFIAVFQEAFPDLRLEIDSSSPTGRPQRPKGPSRAPIMVCFTPPTAMSRRQDAQLSSGGRRFTSPTATR